MPVAFFVMSIKKTKRKINPPFLAGNLLNKQKSGNNEDFNS